MGSRSTILHQREAVADGEVHADGQRRTKRTRGMSQRRSRSTSIRRRGQDGHRREAAVWFGAAPSRSQKSPPQLTAVTRSPKRWSKASPPLKRQPRSSLGRHEAPRGCRGVEKTRDVRLLRQRFTGARTPRSSQESLLSRLPPSPSQASAAHGQSTQPSPSPPQGRVSAALMSFPDH